jgi:hypothetical protein
MKYFVVTFAALAAFAAARALGQDQPNIRSDSAAAGNSAYAGADLNGPDGWRYRWHNGRWWYWLPESRWMYWDNDHWADCGANAYVAGYTPQSADVGRSTPHTSNYTPYSDSYTPSYGTGYRTSVSPDYYGTGSWPGWGWGHGWGSRSGW